MAAVAIPGAVLIVATACLLLALPLGIDPLWQVEPVTLAEAAALRDTGEFMRLIDRGQDPNRAQTVRADLLRNEPVVITPLEAAVAVDRPEVLQVLLDNGAVLDNAIWTRLSCFAREIGADDARTVLDARRPAGAADECDHVETPW